MLIDSSTQMPFSFKQENDETSQGTKLSSASAKEKINTMNHLDRNEHGPCLGDAMSLKQT